MKTAFNRLSQVRTLFKNPSSTTSIFGKLPLSRQPRETSTKGKELPKRKPRPLYGSGTRSSTN
jgi:hypothetical protein